MATSLGRIGTIQVVLTDNPMAQKFKYTLLAAVLIESVKQFMMHKIPFELDSHAKYDIADVHTSLNEVANELKAAMMEIAQQSNSWFYWNLPEVETIARALDAYQKFRVADAVEYKTSLGAYHPGDEDYFDFKWTDHNKAALEHFK